MNHTALEAFFAGHPIFTVAEVDHFLNARRGGKATNPQTRQALLGYYQEQGRLRHVRRGLYAVERLGEENTQGRRQRNEGTFDSADSFLIAARLTSDAVLVYHTALELHGLTHTIREERLCLSQQKLVRPLRFGGILYRAIRPPAALPACDQLTLGVETHDRQGLPLRVTGLERTLVDILDRPALAGGWEEVVNCWDGVALALDFVFLRHYVRLLGNATTAARLGYVLEAGQERLAVPKIVLADLRELAPRQPHPAERGQTDPTRLVRPWNLLVPAIPAEEPFQGKTSYEAIL